jgi:hypothetical protein
MVVVGDLLIEPGKVYFYLMNLKNRVFKNQVILLRYKLFQQIAKLKISKVLPLDPSLVKKPKQ